MGMGLTNGIDTTGDTTGLGKKIYLDAGYSSVIKYCVSDAMYPHKSFTLDEQALLRAIPTENGHMRVGHAFEVGNDISYFNAERGVEDGNRAVAHLTNLNATAGAGIYFCYDNDFPLQQIAGPIFSYANALAPIVRAAKYTPGAYGGGALLQYLFSKGKIDLRWLSMSIDWRGSLGYSVWDIKQVKTINIFGLDCDTNIIRGSAGLY